MKTNFFTKLAACTFACVFVLSSSMFAQTLSTDESDYGPGDVVQLTGTGFAAGESVSVRVTHNPTGGDDSTSADHQPWNVTANGSGGFSTSWTVPVDQDELDAALIATANGQSSASHAEAPFTDGHPAGNLDQGQNGGVGETPIDPVAWVNGNLNRNNSHLHEGESTPFRLKMTHLDVGTHTVSIEWDIRHGGKNAYDYITDFHQGIDESVDPIAGTGLANVFTTYPIPTPPTNMVVNGYSQPQTSFSALQAAGETNMTLYNGTITSMVYDAGNLGNLSDDISSTRLVITFIANGETAVLAWGGHIASRVDWGNGNSAGAIHGSPYHTRLIVLDGQGGNQDRSMKLSVDNCNLDISATQANTSCHNGNNGSIDVTASGAFGEVSYLWNDGATTEDRTGLSAGTYIVTATDDGYCTDSLTLTITQPNALGVSGVVVNVSASGGHDGSIDVSVTGGTSPYTYLWNDGATTQDRSGLGAGTYTLTITDHNGCAAAQSFTITQPCSLQLTLTCKKPKCYGGNDGSINITATGAIGSVSYLWNDGVTTEDRTGLSAGNYAVTATDQYGCSATISRNIANPSQLIVSETHVNISAFAGHNGSIDISVSGGSGVKRTYLWNNGATTQDRSGLSAGTYTVTAYDAHHCAVSKTVVITQPAGKDAFGGTNDFSMKIYPNPAENDFNLEVITDASSDEDYTILVENILGQTVYSTQSVTSSGIIQKSISFDQSIRDGMYMVHVIIGGKEFTKQLMIQHGK